MAKLFLLFALVCSTLSQNSNYPTFSEFVQIYNKNYGQSQYAYRKGVYQIRIASFEAITDYTPGVNHMSDWNQQEIAVLSSNNVAPHPQQTQSARVSTQIRLAAPASLDWRDQNAVTPPKDQGTCGSCWAFASAAYSESKLILDGKYTKDNIDLSEQYVLSCTSESDCGGGYMEYAMQTARNLPLQSVYPYTPNSVSSGICSTTGINVAAISYDYYDLTDEQIINLLQVGPVGASIASTGWSNYGSGVFRCGITAQLDHAILIVGYTADQWIIKNQWGLDWGEGGYMRLTRDRTLRGNCLVGTSIHVMWEKISTYAISVMLMALVIIF